MIINDTGHPFNSEILELKEKLRLETERADRNYEVAKFFEDLYDSTIDWITSEEVE